MWSQVRIGLVISALIVGGAACSSAGRSSAPPTGPCSGGMTCLSVDHGRFSVMLPESIAGAGDQVGVSVYKVITDGLTRIAAVLPGAQTLIQMAPGTDVIPSLGVTGHTNTSGDVGITVDTRRSGSSLRYTLTSGIVQALSHESDESVRIRSRLATPNTLLNSLIREGLASAFDLQIQPALNLPFLRVLSPAEEAQMWQRARPLLADTGMEQWFFGGGGVPPYTGFQIGYHIVRGYLARHPTSTAASIVELPSSQILAGSGYAP